MRIVQFSDENEEKRVAKVDGDNLIPTIQPSSLFYYVKKAVYSGQKLPRLIKNDLSDKRLDYQEIVDNRKILSPIDHPDTSKFLITGTGLTHLGSADARDEMHKAEHTDDSEKTDTMKMFELGLKGGKPGIGETGVQPEWFYKGDGTTVRKPEHPIYSPSFALLDGDEVEVCAFHYISDAGIPFRIGYALGNEFADHTTEKMNYLYLAHSKLRDCSFGPELLIDDLPTSIKGKTKIIRDGKIIWEKEFLSGEDHMVHSIRNLEEHHFKYRMFRQPGFLHAHFLGTGTVSFADNFEPEDGDIFEMICDTFGKPLRNTLIKLEKDNYSIKSLL